MFVFVEAWAYLKVCLYTDSREWQIICPPPGRFKLQADTGRAGVAHPGSSEIGYSFQVRGVLGAGSRSALPRRFSVVFEYGGLIP